MVENDKYDEFSIQVVEGLEPVRLRPSMYVGDITAPIAPVMLLRQALCHAVDRALDGACTRIDIATSGPVARVTYDAGMPLEVHPRLGHIVAALFLTLRAGCRNLKKHVEVGDELCDLGLSVLNALCEEMEVSTACNGRTAVYIFRKGRAANEPRIVATEHADSTAMCFRLDTEIFGDNVLFDHSLLSAAADHIQTLVPQASIRIAAETV